MQEAEAARDFSKVMEHVAAGDEVLLERNGLEFAKVMAATMEATAALAPPKPRTIQEVIAALEDEERQLGPIMIDPEYSKDLASAHAFWNQPVDASAWD